eukprot:CAMPEP_0113273634 /NCGR_PEP_ID=MMETSP0008_2-20120614/23958_1 /TAXON_ID=97485 /ORGANISM="Prymnesium parvum" /LENGTH=133 /DNA_ID=CAMNT_0000123169 /DNA_START=1047 /DNA_END=1450 /DNA_ORIENTATION=- /assembly_acc=CAM_ASM_000153
MSCMMNMSKMVEYSVEPRSKLQKPLLSDGSHLLLAGRVQRRRKRSACACRAPVTSVRTEEEVDSSAQGEGTGILARGAGPRVAEGAKVEGLSRGDFGRLPVCACVARRAEACDAEEVKRDAVLTSRARLRLVM